MSELVLSEIEGALASFDLEPDQAGVAMGVLGIAIETRRKLEANLVAIFAGRLTPTQITRAVDAAVAVMAHDFTPEKLGAGRRLASLAVLSR